MSIRILFGRQDPEIIGDNGANRLQSGQTTSYLYGLGGDDVFSIRDGVDAFLVGGSGNDSYTYAGNAITYILESGNSSNDIFIDRFDLTFSKLTFLEIDDRHLVIVGSGSPNDTIVVIFDWESPQNRIERWQIGPDNVLSFEQFRSAVLASASYGGVLSAEAALGVQTANDFRRVLNQLSVNARDYEEGSAQTPVLRISEARVTEGDTQSQALTFNISLSQAASTDVSFRLFTFPNTALAGLDYDSVDRVVTIPRGQTSVTATVNVRGDLLREGTENFLIAASDITGARPDSGLSFAFAFGTIDDNETGTLATLRVSNVAVTEGVNGFARFTVTLSGPLASDVTFNARTEAATALPGADYTHVERTVTIRAGSTTATIDVPVRSDAIAESDEAFRLILSRPQGAIFINQEAELIALATIQDDDRRNLPNDTLFSQQYYLLNTGQSVGLPGADLNLMPLSGQYTGRNINILVVDEGIDYTNRDFLGAFNRATDSGVTFPFDDAFPIRSGDAHGTFVAGIIGARAGDGFGIAGVAPQSQLHGFRLDFGTARDFFADMTASFVEASRYDIANYSLGFTSPFVDSAFNARADSMLNALITAVSEGRNGLGTVVIFAAGNEFDKGSDVNLYGLQSSINVITVAALDRNWTFSSIRESSGYSTSGAAILISAPGSSIISTDIAGSRGYSVSDHTIGDGTSFAAPMVAGVVALMLEANPRLGFRDVQEILALTARQNDQDDGDWEFNGARTFNGGGAHYNTNYGFGAVDAQAAVRLAETWENQSQTQKNRVFKSLPITGGPIDANGSRFMVRINESIDLQHVRVQLDFSFTRFSDIEIVLISPSGTTSELLFRPTGGEFTSISQIMQLTSVHFWGENPVGEWQLVIRDRGTNPAIDTGVLRSANLVLVGSQANANDVYVYTDEFTNLALTDPSRRTLDDADGLTTLNLAAMTTPSVVNLATGQATLGGTAVSITARTTVSTVFAGDGDDRLTGTDRAETLWGGRGNDEIVGSGGNDTIWGREGNDTLRGGSGNDLLLGGTGDDVLDGGEGFDTVYYNFDSISGGVRIDMRTNQVTGPSGTDTLSSIEAIWGSSFADQFFGSDAEDMFIGDGGNDFANGGGGIDIFQINDDFIDAILYFIESDIFIYTPVDGLDKLQAFETILFAGGTTTTKSVTELRASPAPTITAFSPADGASNVAANSNISFIFSEAISAGFGSVELRLESPTGTLVEAFAIGSSPRLSINGTTLTIDPTSNLLAGSRYFVVLPGGIVKDADNNGFAGTSTYDFTTAPPADTTPPTVVTFSPADGATNVATGSNVVVTFSETIARGIGTIEIRSGSASGPVVESFDAATSNRLTLSGRTLTIDPLFNLPGSASLFISMPAGSVVDSAGNRFPGVSTYDFSTASGPTAGRIIVNTNATAALIDGTYDLFGTNAGNETIIVYDGGVANLAGDFSRGGDKIALRGQAKDFQVQLSGSNAIITSGIDKITARIPIGTIGISIFFEDSAGNLSDKRTLIFNGNNVLIGNQIIDFVSSNNLLPAQSTGSESISLPSYEIDSGRIVVNPSSTAPAIIGKYDVFGTNLGREIVIVYDGTTVNLQGDFSRGGDTLALRGPAQNFQIGLSGSNAIISSISDNIVARVPIGTAGITIIFENYLGNFVDARTLQFNGTVVLLGTQEVQYTPSQVSAYTAPSLAVSDPLNSLESAPLPITVMANAPPADLFLLG